MTETAQLQQEARERQIWYAFFVSHRDIVSCDANRKLLDDFLTANLKTLSVENLDEAYASIVGQLAKRNLTSQPRAQVTQETASVPATVEVGTELDSAIPLEYTRDFILYTMDKEAFRTLAKKYGNRAIEYRVNKIQHVEEER